MSTERTYINAAQQRILALIERMAPHVVEGVMPGELAKAQRTQPSNITRDLANLRAAGWAEPLDTGRWRLTPRAAHISLQVADALARAQDRMEELRQRFTRTR